MTRHIITLEDPIEYLHVHGRSLINQREIGRDTKTFASGIRSALRQDPDVILVGEMRDAETIRTAITAAETGHLVLSTLHTITAPQTIDRVINVFPGDEQQHIRTQLASVLAGVICQRLFPVSDGSGRIAGTEILVNVPSIANLIRSDKIHQIKTMMETGRQWGMQTMEQSVKQLVSEKKIAVSTADQLAPGWNKQY
jgi:twitching motility protein PilT